MDKKKNKKTRYFEAPANEGKVEVFSIDVDAVSKRQIIKNRFKFDKNKQDKDTKLSDRKKDKKKVKLKHNDKPQHKTLHVHGKSRMDKPQHKTVHVHGKSRLEILENRRKRKEWFENKGFRQGDPFPGDAPISDDLIKKYDRGDKMDTTYARTKFAKEKLIEKEKKLTTAVKQAARSEILLHETTGFIETEDNEDTTQLSQHDIANAVDITSAQKV